MRHWPYGASRIDVPRGHTYYIIVGAWLPWGNERHSQFWPVKRILLRFARRYKTGSVPFVSSARSKLKRHANLSVPLSVLLIDILGHSFVHFELCKWWRLVRPDVCLVCLQEC